MNKEREMTDEIYKMIINLQKKGLIYIARRDLDKLIEEIYNGIRKVLTELIADK